MLPLKADNVPTIVPDVRREREYIGGVPEIGAPLPVEQRYEELCVHDALLQHQPRSQRLHEQLRVEVELTRSGVARAIRPPTARDQHVSTKGTGGGKSWKKETRRRHDTR